MSDDHSAARDVAVSAALGFADQFKTPLVRMAIEMAIDKALAALTAAGYQITRRDPAAGRVCVSVDQMLDVLDAYERGELSKRSSREHIGCNGWQWHELRRMAALRRTETTTAGGSCD